MRASDVRDCLALRWPDSEYLCIPEAPEDSSRAGRKIDLLVIALWRSRGLERDAVEIKVSLSDWNRELKRGRKADFWWLHSNRFWVAVPVDLAPKVRETLPMGWGLLACEPGKSPKVAVKPERREAAELSWQCTVGVMRAAANCGLSALQRAEGRGRTQGIEEGKRQAERESGDGVARRALEDLRERVKKFEAASGLDITKVWDAGDLGATVAIVLREMRDPGWVARHVGFAADCAVNQAEELLKRAKEAKSAAKRVSEALKEAA